MPCRKSACASWNCLMQNSKLPRSNSPCQERTKGKGDPAGSSRPQKISVTFDVNRLQRIPGPGEPGSPGRVLVSLNPIQPPRDIKGTYVYHHPLSTSASFQVSRHLHLINGVKILSFAGAWMGHGFHEDGFRSGLQAAEIALGSHKSSTGRHQPAAGTRHPIPIPIPQWRLLDRFWRALIQLVQLSILFLPHFHWSRAFPPNFSLASLEKLVTLCLEKRSTQVRLG